MKIVVYTDAAGIGGAEISLGHLMATVAEDIDLTIVGTCPHVIDAIAQRRPQAICCILPEKGLSAFFAHLRTFTQLRPDIIHFNLCTPWASTIGLSAALLVPQVRIVRVDQLPLRTTDTLTLMRTRSLALRVDAHVAVGETSCRRMEDFYALGRHSLISIPNGVPDQWTNLPLFPMRSPFHLVVGSIGRLDAMKAHDILLQAISQIEGMRLVILGEGEQRAYLEGLAKELGISDRIDLPGWVNRPHEYLTQFDIVALPSRSEGFPLAMVEAMLAARPIIVTRVGSMPEAIIEGETGLLVEKNDITGLIAVLRRLQDNPNLRRHLGKQAREMALSHFTAEAMATQYERLWYHLLTTPKVSRLRVPRPKD